MTKKYIIFIIGLIAIGALAFGNLAWATGCPSNTTVSGTTVNFVGEITDMGGDAQVSGWFEYGKTTSYGQTTSQKTMSQLGIYCITASNLEACTTYHYRAVAQNTAGTSYGDDKTFTTSCGATVDLKANGSDGPITVPFGSSVTLSWTSNNANSCSASGGWSGSKSTSGSETIHNLNYSKTFTLNCSGTAGSDSDSVTVDVGSASLSVSLSTSPSSGCVPLNSVDLIASVSGNVSGSMTFLFDCTNDGTWEKVVSSVSNPYKAFSVCSYGSVGNYTVKVKVESQGTSAEDTENINVFSCTSLPTVSLTANGYDGSVTIPYNSAATLNWSSTNANSCHASGDWAGYKSIAGSQSTGNLTSSKTYTITCTGTGGSTSDTVTVNIGSAGDLTVNKLVRNLSDGTGFGNSVAADPSEFVSFSIQVTASDYSNENVIVKDTLPGNIVYRSNSLEIDGVSSGGDIFSGLNIGSLSANQTKNITFNADIAGPNNFAFGTTQLINSAIAYTTNKSNSDTATVMVTKSGVAGAATVVPTGLTNNILVDSLIIPLAIALILLWFFRSHIIKWEQWLDGRKKVYREYKSDKLLRLKAKKIRLQEFLKRKAA